jgi:Fe2+ transport system protein FeoA
MVPLSFAGIGEYTIKSVRGGRGMRRRLISMGINEGDKIRIIKPAPGPIIIAKNNIRIGIGFGMAKRIFVI